MKDLQEILDFEPIQGNAPVMICNGCGKNTMVKEIAVIHPFENQNSDYSVAVCSDRCREMLLNPKYKNAVTMMITEGICNISARMNEQVSDKFHRFFQRLQ